MTRACYEVYYHDDEGEVIPSHLDRITIDPERMHEPTAEREASRIAWKYRPIPMCSYSLRSISA